MRLIKTLSKLIGKKRSKGKAFTDLSSREKKQLLSRAAREANKMQLDLVRKFERKFNLSKVLAN